MSPVILQCTERGESVKVEDHKAFDILARNPFKCHLIFLQFWDVFSAIEIGQ